MTTVKTTKSASAINALTVELAELRAAYTALRVTHDELHAKATAAYAALLQRARCMEEDRDVALAAVKLVDKKLEAARYAAVRVTSVLQS